MRGLKLALLPMAAILAGCTRGVFDPKGSIATAQNHLFFVSLVLMLIVVIPVVVMVVWFAIKYRHQNTKADYAPNWAHNTWLEVVWWTVPLILIVILSVMTWITSHTLDPYKPLDSKVKPLTIDVVALNWKWLFIYPKQKIATVNFVQFPINTPINFNITADAPMNSFVIPQLGGQIYAMTGMTTKLHLITKNPADYRGRSVNFSGNGFYGMKFIARASSQKSFEQWVQKVKRSSQSLNARSYHDLAKWTENHPVTLYGSVIPGLFKSIINHYTKPGHLKGVGTPEGL